MRDGTLVEFEGQIGDLKCRRIVPFGNTEAIFVPLKFQASEAKRISALVSVEMWRKNENAVVMEQFNKDTFVTVKDFFKPAEWADKETGEFRQRVILAATSEVCILDTNEDALEETEKP